VLLNPELRPGNVTDVLNGIINQKLILGVEFALLQFSANGRDGCVTVMARGSSSSSSSSRARSESSADDASFRAKLVPALSPFQRPSLL
jgi:hypothetical protein